MDSSSVEAIATKGLVTGMRRRARVLSSLSALVLLVFFSAPTLAAITYVQGNSLFAASQQVSVSVTYTAAQNAGDLNVIKVWWADTNVPVASVVDSKGNTYVRAVGPTADGGSQQSVYYAKNIAAAAAGGNTVTITFNASVWYPEVINAEYSGIDTASPLDGTQAATGYAATADSGPLTTTNANDLLVGTGTSSAGLTGAGTGFTSRVLSSYGVLEDRVVATAGSYNATAPVSGTSSWTMQIAAFKAAGGTDTIAPSAPTSVTANAVSSSQINLSWTASTDNVGVTGYLVDRCSGASCSNFTQIATPTTTSYSDTGLSASTSYTYRVRAKDAANNISAPSNATTSTQAPDTQAPTVPTNVTATGASTSQVNVSWTAATDNVGVAGYFIERCMGASCTGFQQVGTSTTTSYTDPGLTASTSYSYRVRANDASNNMGGYSAVASVTTPAAAGGTDTQAPTAPTSLVATAISGIQVNLSWIGANDNVGIAGYRLERCSGSGCSIFAQIATPTITNYSDTGLSGTTSYTYRVRAVDAANNPGTYSSSASTTTLSSSNATIRIHAAGPTYTDSASNVWAADSGYNTGSPFAYGTIGITGTSDPELYRNERWDDVPAPELQYSFPVANGTYLVKLYFAENYIDSTFPNGGIGQRTFSVDLEGIRALTSLDIFAQAGAHTATVKSALTNVADGQLNIAFVHEIQNSFVDAIEIIKQADDTTTPSAPTGLSATAASSTQINLTWTAATDNVAVAGYFLDRCTGASCSTFAQIASPTTTSYSDTGLTAATSYSYRVHAKDGANNISPNSSTVSATTQAGDVTPPNPPTGLTATAVSSTQINLSWTASTDNVGVTGYMVERCQGASCSFTQIATPTSTTYSDAGLVASTSYSYRVRAKDAANNNSNYSSTANATTQSGGAATITYRQGNSIFAGTQQSTALVTFTSAQSAGNLNVVKVWWADATASVTSVTDTSGNTYVRAVGPTAWGGAQQSIYYAKSIASASASTNIVTVTFSASVWYPDVIVAEYSGLDTASPVDVTQVGSGSGTTADSGAVTTTNPNDLLVGSSTSNSGFTGAGTNYTLRVTSGSGAILEDRVVTSTGAYNATAPNAAANAWIMQLVAFKAATGGGGDTVAPTAPTGLTATATSSSQINLSWTAATDNVGVTGYQLERCSGASCTIFAQIATPTTTTYSDTGLAASTSYSYRVRATDAASNLSTFSSTASATTPAPSDTQAPTAPSGLIATAIASTQINLSWTAASDNVAVTGYLVERCSGASCSTFAPISTPTTTSYSDTGLTASTSYTYRVRAKDAANNMSTYSGTASAITQTPPSAPSGLNVTAASSTEIDFAWTAASSGIGISGYVVERCQGASCSSFGQIATTNSTTFYQYDAGLTASTSYSYRVRATDTAGNVGPYSTVLTAPTLAAANCD